MVVIDRMALGAFLGTLGNSTFFQNASGHLLLGDFLEFVATLVLQGSKMGAKMGEGIFAKWARLPNGRPKWPK